MTNTMLSVDTSQQVDMATSAVGTDTRFSLLQKFKQNHLANLRPLSEFFDKNRLNFTLSFQTVTARWNYNLQYFSANYALIVLGLAAYAIITNWLLIFTVLFIVGGFYGISRINGPLSIGNYTVSGSSLYASYAGASIVLLLFSGVTGTVFWIIGAGAMVVLGHAAVLEPGLEQDFAQV